MSQHPSRRSILRKAQSTSADLDGADGWRLPFLARHRGRQCWRTRRLWEDAQALLK
jgi:hypothetical protein